MGKLVRDRIPEIIRSSGGDPAIRVLDDDAYARALRAKLLEEAGELHAATGDDVVTEAADVLEVVLAILRTNGLDLGDLIAARDAKLLERGGFDRGLWLET